MLIIGLTGSIGMGKTTAARRFSYNGIPVFDSDAEVHSLYEGPLIETIEKAFPGVVIDGKVDRTRLSAIVLSQPADLEKLEKIVHPAVREAQRKFLKDAFNRGADMALLEVPLLFETGADKFVDVTVVVSTTPDQQRRRSLKRPGMTSEKFDAILSEQMTDEEKRSKADFVVDTSGEISETELKIDKLIESLKGRSGQKFALWTEATI